MIFESHAHYEDARFDEDRTALLELLPKRNISHVINVGSTIETSKASLDLAQQYSYIYAALGVHPSEIDCFNEAGIAWLAEHAQDPNVVAIGEIGLDYYWDKEKEVQLRQKKCFLEQLSLAREVSLPVIIHSRDAAADTMEILKDAAKQGTRAVVHCYSYSYEMAKEYLRLGFFIGIGGVVTFKNSHKMQEVVREIPLERILIETDSPYLAPEPFRGQRNDSTYLPYVIQEIAKLRGISEEEVMQQTSENAIEFFGV